MLILRRPTITLPIAFRIPTDITNQHESFQCVLSSLARFPKNFPEVTHLKFVSSQTRLIMEYLIKRLVLVCRVSQQCWKSFRIL